MKQILILLVMAFALPTFGQNTMTDDQIREYAKLGKQVELKLKKDFPSVFQITDETKKFKLKKDVIDMDGVWVIRKSLNDPETLEFNWEAFNFDYYFDSFEADPRIDTINVVTDSLGNVVNFDLDTVPQFKSEMLFDIERKSISLDGSF